MPGLRSAHLESLRTQGSSPHQQSFNVARAPPQATCSVQGQSLVHGGGTLSLLPLSSPPPPSSSSPMQLSETDRLKRKIATLQEEILDLNGSKHKQKIMTKTLGRGILKTASMFVSVMPLVMENYQREDESDNESDEEESEKEGLLSVQDLQEKQQKKIEKHDRDRNFEAFQIVCEIVSGFKKTVSTTGVRELRELCSQLDAGAVQAHGDNINSTKEAIVDWLDAHHHKPQPSLKRKTHTGRGFRNDTTGRLLCPIDLNWDDAKICSSIHKKETHTNDNYFIQAFYRNKKGDPEDLEKGFLQSDLLVKIFCHIFTSASSVDEEEALSNDEDNNKNDPEPPSKHSHKNRKRSTRKSVTQLLNMENVTPRSIAYACVLLRFGLLEASAWNVDRSFNYQGLYNMVIDYFEEVQPNSLAEKHIKKLLQWWTRHVFADGEDASESVKPLMDAKNRLAAQRAAKEAHSAAAQAVAKEPHVTSDPPDLPVGVQQAQA